MRESRLIRADTVSDPALNTALARSVWIKPCRTTRASIYMRIATVTGTTPSLTLMPQVDLAGTWTDMLAAGMTFTANDQSFMAALIRFPTRDDGFRIVATAKSGTTPGVTGLDVILRCGAS